MEDRNGPFGNSALVDRLERQKPPPDGSYYPEGGWGYVVVLAAFAALMTQMGLIVSMGVYLEHIEQEFQSGAGVSGWISSGCFAVLAFVSPFASHVMKRMGCRATAMIGGAIMCAGFVCGTFANSVIQLFVFADVVAGIGASMSHMSGTVVIGQYFNKRYALANGFAYTGQGVGIFMFPPILQALIDNYGWRGCMLIQGALSLHISAAAAMYRVVQQPSGNRSKRRPRSVSCDSVDSDGIRATPNNNQNNGSASNTCSGISEDSGSKTDSTAVSASEISTSTGLSSSEGCAEMKSLVVPSADNSTKDQLQNGTAVCAHERALFPSDSTALLQKCGDFELKSQAEPRLLNGNERVISPLISCRRHQNALVADVNPTVFATSDIQSGQRNAVCFEEGKLGICGIEGRKPRRRRKWPAAWRMMCDYPSICFIFVIFLFETFGYGGFFSHVVARAREAGIAEGPATFALSIFGIGSLLGRSSNGLILHRGFLTARGLNGLAFVTAGGASVLTSLVVSQSGVLASAFFSGLASGWYMPLQQVLLRDIVGQSLLHFAYGYGLVFEGAGSLAGGYVIGSIRDRYGSYEVSFYFLGVVMLLGSSILVVDHCFQRRGLCLSINDSRDKKGAKNQPTTADFDKDAPV